MFFKTLLSAAFAVFLINAPATATKPSVAPAETTRSEFTAKQYAQATHYRGPCRRGDNYNRQQKQCKGVTSAIYAPGDPAAGRCKAGDYYTSRRQDCIGKDKKRYEPNVKQAVSFIQSKKQATEHRQKRRAALAKKNGCKAGDGWNRRKKMCVHYYKGKK